MREINIWNFKIKLNERLKSQDIQKIKEKTIGPYETKQCTNEKKQKEDLKMYKINQKVVDKMKFFRCNYCSFKSKHKGVLENHEIIHWFRCNLCSYETKRKWSFKRHEQIHNREIQWIKCVWCPYKTKLRNEFEQHKIIHDRNKFTIHV